MICPCHNRTTDAAQEEKTLDRYVSFIGLACDEKADQLFVMIHRWIDNPEHSNAFWEYFKQRAAGGSGPRPDNLFLIHSYINQLRELFETHEDSEGLTLLERIEKECC